LEQHILQIYHKNKINFKKDFCVKLLNSVEHLKQNKIYHRDLHYGNILLNFTNELHVFIIDFNVSKKHNSSEQIRRGSIRYYPIWAIDGMYNYNFECDKYMASFIMYEIIEEHEIYPECKGNTKEILKMRRQLIFPKWSENAIKDFDDKIKEINKIWQESI
jgi:serine/threonine protein kinase